MIIQWFGNACCKLSAQGGDASVVIDPYGPSAGKLPRLQADIVISTTDSDFSRNLDGVKASHERVFAITNPGEYEISGVFMRGTPVVQKDSAGAESRTSIFSVTMDDIRVGHLGMLARELGEAELDALGKIDILLLPVGGSGLLDHKKACAVIASIEPRMIIPFAYAIPGSTRSFEPLEAFLKECGTPSPETVDKLKIQKKDLPSEESRVIIVKQG